MPKSNLVSLGDLHETAKGQDYQSFFRRLTENATRLQESFFSKKMNLINSQADNENEKLCNSVLVS